MTNTNKRDVKQSAIERDTLYEALQNVTAFEENNYEVVGRATEGIVVRNREEDTYMVVKVIAKALDFDAFDAIDEYAEKAVKAQEKADKAKAKAAKDKAKREEAKAKAEAKAE